MKVTDKGLISINLRLREIAIKCDRKQITDEDYQKEREELEERRKMINMSYANKLNPKKEKVKEKKTVPTKLGMFFGKQY